MTPQQLNRGFEYVSEGELLLHNNKCIEHLLKVQKCATRLEARNLVNEVLTRMADREYRTRFTNILLGINPNGISVSRSFTKNLRKEMRIQLSIWRHFETLNRTKQYEQSGMKAAVRNAKGILNHMPSQSKFTF